MDAAAADTRAATDTVTAALYTADDLDEAQHALHTTWTPWPTGATPITVADALRQARTNGYIPHRTPNPTGEAQ